ERSFSVAGGQQAALLRVLPLIVRFKQWFELRVPLAHEVRASLFHPAFEIRGTNCVRTCEHRMRRIELYYLRVLLHDFLRPSRLFPSLPTLNLVCARTDPRHCVHTRGVGYCRRGLPAARSSRECRPESYRIPPDFRSQDQRPPASAV